MEHTIQEHESSLVRQAARGDNLSSRRSVATISVVVESVDKESVEIERVFPSSETAVYQRLKLCKRGHREALVERQCGVSFEGLPVWL